ncbi:hypothetical protein CPB84DRAFT_1201937 [Gymnopilus junonius]|uniref:Protein CPL1-like domain-containing protein n=1 Tax=Gymnopilus junonius TaxID=109634 RepID=A0A9P5NKW1_GYMJU|nr:hypothetical protein CPB84DRAFT_1201937 [Gymnopilus junonius]
MQIQIKSGGHGTCKYPQHSQPQCQFGNPCGFTCTDGYSPYPYSRPTECICSKPYMVCNDRCGLFKGCPSQYYKRGEASPSYGLNCAKGLTTCPIPGRGGEYFECVNTQNDLESCGGCITPSLPSYGYYSTAKEGADCSALPGVSDVSCVYGKCVVYKCSYGYSLNKVGECVPIKGYYA